MRWLLSALVVMGGLAIVVPVPAQEKPERAKTDAELLVGTWQILALEEDGLTVKDSKLKTIIIRASKKNLNFCWQPKDPSLKPLVLEASIKPKAMPKAFDGIDPTSPQPTAGVIGMVVGIYQLKGNDLKICQRKLGFVTNVDSRSLDISRPKTFQTGKGDRSVLYILKRVTTSK